VPTRKQRRRRDKTFRHDYETVLIDEEGNETPLTDLRTHDEPAPAKNGSAQKAKAPAKGSRGGRGGREVAPPSWERAIKRGGTWGVVMLLLCVLFLFKSAPIAERVLLGLMYAVLFVPLTYFVDRTAYRAYLRRSSAPARGAKKK
jgi:hypothetical protein